MPRHGGQSDFVCQLIMCRETSLNIDKEKVNNKIKRNVLLSIYCTGKSANSPIIDTRIAYLTTYASSQRFSLWDKQQSACVLFVVLFHLRENAFGWFSAHRKEPHASLVSSDLMNTLGNVSKEWSKRTDQNRLWHLNGYGNPPNIKSSANTQIE